MNRIKGFLVQNAAGLAAAAAACFIVLVYGPLELYFTNRSDFWFAPEVILPDVLLLFALGLTACVLLLALAGKFCAPLYTVFTGAMLWCAVVCYIQSNFLSGWLPSMDGQDVDWSAYPEQRAASLVLCGAAAILIALLARKKWLKKAALWGGSLLTLLLAVTVTVLGIGSSSSSAGNMYHSGTEDLQEYSSDRNLVIFVVDMVDGGTFESVVNENEDYRNALRDFTYYSNTLCAYPYTYYAVPQLLSGEWYEGGEVYDVFRSRCLRESPLFERLQSEGWRMGLYMGDQMFDKNAEPERFTNLRWTGSEIVSHPAFWRVILRMSCVKNAPYDLKRLGYSLPEKLNGLKYGNLYDADAWFTGNNVDFLESCRQAESAQSNLCGEKVFKYIHVEGAHYPLRYGPHLEDVQGTEQASYKNNVAGTVYLLGEYLDMLRENGTYDNTAVVILSDHGFAQDENGREINAGRQHSVLLVKGFGESHDYTVNEAPVSYVDLQTIYSRLLDGALSDSVTDWQAGDQRERRYLNYTHQISAEEGQTAEVDSRGFVEMLLTGDAADTAALQPTGTVYTLPRTVWN